ncbi:uncharacterized protein N7515_008544 [Penicillium bovifimosum]|uniref:EGF-like domain-containing protein n=1 Tax=Penicillium bovifimosum TaxID=126998 RepID=A0A9W9KWH0_9EURO|nr:uncharacterized protein N7515_008544 [Penicillium bovifimosum]KAJ5124719.1 hypothetical protein N7515_008544 [Penicillium bovifimosum]
MSTDITSPELRGDPKRQGSVKRARQLLEAGLRPAQPPPNQERGSPTTRKVSQETQWPLTDTSLPAHPIKHHLKPPPLRGLPPQRPPHPNEMPSPSIYSERDGQDSEIGLGHEPMRQPFMDAPVSPTSTIDMTPRISIATDELFRHSTASSTPSIPNLPPCPPPYAPPFAPAISPVPEWSADPRSTKCSVASSRAIPSSWGSGPAESEILGAYLDMESDTDQRSSSLRKDDIVLVRNASLGKRGKPTMRTYLKPGPAPESAAVDPPVLPQATHTRNAVAASTGLGAAANQTRTTSTSTGSEKTSKCDNPEEPPRSQQHESICSTGLEKELEAFGALPRAAPTLSNTRPGGRKPPALNMHALRDAEARGSLSSLSDLIRRATKLASNLDRGKTASREVEFRGGMGTRRNSGSLSDILASFPPPGWATPEGGRSSWSIFFGRSNLRNVEPLGSDADEKDAPRRRKTCCGIPRKLFVLLCILLFIIVILAVLLPVFLIAVPREKASASCAQRNPCENGGVSVSGGTECSCVCSDGYTGSRCTVAGDDSCTTALIKNGSNATMGSALPTLFDESEKIYNIALDPVTIMAIFSMNNVSCKTENALVSFSDVKTDDTSKSRRSAPLADTSVSEDSIALNASPSVTGVPTPATVAARAEATENGILYEDPESSKSATATSIPTRIPSATGTSAMSLSSPAEAQVSNSTGVPEKVVGFSRIAVLYILQKTGSLDSAMSSEDAIQEYLTDSYAKAAHPSMAVGAFSLDFDNLVISLPNSTAKAE